MNEISIQKNYALAQFVFLSILGYSLITTCSLVKVPFSPVPFTLQTAAIFFLALTQSPLQAFGSVMCYLVCGTIGLPVFAGHTNPLWMLGKCGGYLVAFPIAAYITSQLAKKKSQILAIFTGQFLIYLLGFLWLIPLFGSNLPSDLLRHGKTESELSKWEKAAILISVGKGAALLSMFHPYYGSNDMNVPLYEEAFPDSGTNWGEIKRKLSPLDLRMRFAFNMISKLESMEFH